MKLILLLALLILLASCTGNTQRTQLTLAVVSGVEGEALKQAAADYEKQTGTHIDIAEFPYSNLFEKELIDLKARTQAYDLIMLDDPWFPRFAHEHDQVIGLDPAMSAEEGVEKSVELLRRVIVNRPARPQLASK